MNDNALEALRNLLILHEGLKLKPYKDTVGKTTIGVGRNLDDVGISKDEAFTLLDNDIDRVVTQLRKTYDWFDSLDDVRQVVVIDICFNIGLGGFEKFIKTINYISSGQWEEAAREMLDSTWANQVGHRAVQLSEMMRTGQYVG